MGMEPSSQTKTVYIYQRERERDKLFFFIHLFIYYLFIFGCVGSLVLRAVFSLVLASGGCSSLRCTGFSLQWLLLLQSTGSRCVGSSSCGTRSQQLCLVGSRAQVQQLWHTGLAAPRHVGSFRTRARTRVPSPALTGRFSTTAPPEKSSERQTFIFLPLFFWAFNLSTPLLLSYLVYTMLYYYYTYLILSCLVFL